VKRRLLSALLSAFLAGSSSIASADWRGNVSYEFSYFPESAQAPADWQTSSSVAADVEFYHDLSDEVSFTVRPYVRVDQRDDERSHADIRELVLTTVGDTWEFNGGIDTVFWGVTESRHLVDVINQTDNVDGVDGEDKLGQVMLNLKLFRDSGAYEFYLLPHFRERTFAGAEGRPFAGAVVDTDAVQYQSSDRSDHIDAAVRWSRSFDYWDLGLHYFHGTARDPLLIPQPRGETIALIPRYVLTDQVGLDAQGLFGDWILKAEVVHRSGREIEDHLELVSGFEYTFVGLLGGLQENDIISTDKCLAEDAGFLRRLICNDRMDLGVVVEVLWDERGDEARHPFQRDLLTGFRFAMNDERSTDALLGIIQDLDGGATTLSLEASTRLYESFRLGVETRIFANTDDDAALSAFRDESFIRVDLSYFF
jgi:hypothetical protein